MEHKEYESLDEDTARVIGTVMGVDVFMENGERFKEGKGYNMCTAIREMWMDGVSEGVLTSMRNIMTNLGFTAEQAMDALGIAEEEREEYLEKLSE